MRDAISLSIDKVKEGKKEKKVLLVVTDGNDNTSDITLEQLVRKARAKRGAHLLHRAFERRGTTRRQKR